MDLMTFQTIDLSVRTSQELDFRLITTSKNNFSENHISRPTPWDSLSAPIFSFGIIMRFWETAHLPLPSPKPTLTLTSHLGQNVGLGEW